MNTIKQVNFIFFLFLLNSFHCKNSFFQNKGFHFYYCNYCGGCLNGMIEENIQAHLNDCSQHSSKFICRECGMVSENFLWHMHFFLFSIQNLFYLFKTKFFKNYSHCFFRSMKYLTQASHPYLQRETMRKWSKGMKETDKKT